jgi:hypothetical protein
MYKIVRVFMDVSIPKRTIKTGLTEEQAMRHCANPETSWDSCRLAKGKARTRAFGPWFDCFKKN